ncbi:Hydroxysteroid dehydrogenase-like protein 2 [Cryptotermes secundus]|uniref:Hydroxysteroid dehydrogenase-like protein 2 n=1 Tax=Cryptotermes secundus TaxID=105785 RepID=A0A2J7PSV5_9NEOP|nr:hydroxysteroid dehydrogenase-like protein 2 [Cryptotermes secundus]PNF19412.1 Hydroxysteroid dehydrogenase-like protein 2 [Cryptotermes secundus]
MINTGKLAGRTVFITGASRGIGKAIALKVARDGANVVIAAKTAEPHPKLPGTIYTAAQEVEAAGGKCLPCIVDVRDEKQVTSAVEEAVKKFGGIDILVNNASAISLTGTLDTEMKRYDLMHQINTRGTFLVSKVCLPYLQKGRNPHILNLSPPLNMDPVWFKNHVAYTMSKYGMSMCVLGMAEEFRNDGIAVNALWPRTAIHTAAIEMLSGREAARVSRKPEIIADAAYAIFCRDSKTFTGNFTVDDEILREEGVTDLDQYAVDPSNKENIMLDFFLEQSPDTIKLTQQKSGSSVGGGQIASLFEKIEANISPELVSKTNAVFHFVVKGSESGDWYIDLKTGKGSAGQGKPPSAADATLSMDSKDFFDLFSGKLKPAGAFMTGKLKISGNLQKAMKLEKLMGMLKSKL